MKPIDRARVRHLPSAEIVPSAQASRDTPTDRVEGGGSSSLPSGSSAPLDRLSRVFARPNAKQQNLVMIDPAAQAHVVIESYSDIPAKRMVALTQPAGNLGAGLWWSGASSLAGGNPEPVEGGGMRGVRLTITSDTVGPLRFERPLLDSVRALRDRAEAGGDARAELRAEASRRGIDLDPASLRAEVTEATERRIVFARTGLAGKHRHRLIVEAAPGTKIVSLADGGFELRAPVGKPAATLTYLTDVAPLTPRAPLDLLAPSARRQLEMQLEMQRLGKLSPAERRDLTLVMRALEDLSAMVFSEKAIAGGWRFQTYFGRDTIQTIGMLRPLLSPQVVEDVLSAALARLSEDGVVAHEEDLLDQAEHVRLEAAMRGEPVPPRAEWSAPIYDRKMIDDDFMLASALADYLCDASVPVARRLAFLSRAASGGRTNLEALRANLELVIARATPYAESVRAGHPDPQKLISLGEGMLVGDWRDSNAGLANGRYPASVNLELVPSTLEKASDMLRVLDDLGSPVPVRADPSALAKLWQGARKHFAIEVTPAQIQKSLQLFLTERVSPSERGYWSNVDIGDGVTVADAAAGGRLPAALRQGWRYSALALDANGAPIPMLSSDGLFGLLGSRARGEAVEEIARLVTTPYPLGLATDAGLLISNPVLSGSADLWETIGPGRYHGAVVWTWLEALGITALTDQAAALEAAGDKAAAGVAKRAVAEIVRQAEAGGDLQTAELYGIGVKRGRLEAQPFQGVGDESVDSWPGNATQLWATALPFLRWMHRQRLLDAGRRR